MFTLNPEIHIIDSQELFNRLVSYTDKLKPNYSIIDTETDSLVIKRLRLFGIGICFNNKKSFYIVWRDKNGNEIWTKEQQDNIKSWLLDISSKSKVIMHNASYDILVLEAALGINLTDYLYCDTQVLKHTVNEEPPFSLKEVSVMILGEGADKSQQDLKDNVIANGGRWLKNDKDMYKADTAILGRYCCYDVVLTYEIFKYYSAKLKEEGLEKLFYEEEVMPLYREVTINMKRQGFPVDIPHFERLKTEITEEINKLEIDIQEAIKEEVQPFVAQLLEEDYPVKTTGNFPKYVAEYFNIPLPIQRKKIKVQKYNIGHNTLGSVTVVSEDTDTIVNTPLSEALYSESITLSAKAIEKQLAANPEFTWFYEWILAKDNTKIPVQILKNKYSIQEMAYFKNNPDQKYRFNLNSTDHLAYWLVEVKGYKADKTDSGKWQIDEDFIETVKSDDMSVQKLQDYKKLNKLLSTYVIGILDRAVNGKLHTDMLAHGTTSGRFASRNPNLNNLPANTKAKSLAGKYTNAIRKGLIAEPGKVLIGCDFSALEPHIAAWVSEDAGLMDIFTSGKDFYSAIAIKQFSITDATPFKDDTPNSFPVKYPELRNIVKTYALAAFYGATAPRIAQVLNKPVKEAQELLEGYFDAFPGVKKFITKTHIAAKLHGRVSTRLGRIRHLPQAQEFYKKYGNNLLDYKWAKKHNLEKERSIFKNILNNAVNMQVQGMAAHCLNRAMIKMTKEFNRLKLDAYIVLPIHDEVLVQCEKSIADQVAKIVKYSMETCVDISPIKLKASPIIGNNYGECK